MTDPGWYVDPLDISQYRYWDGDAWTEAVSSGSAAAEAGSPGSAAAEAGSPGSAAAGAGSPGSAAAGAGSAGIPVVQETELSTVIDDQVTRSISVEDLLGAEGGQSTDLSSKRAFEAPQPFPGADGGQPQSFGTDAGLPPDRGIDGHQTAPPPDHQSIPGDRYDPTQAGSDNPSWIPQRQPGPRPVSPPQATQARSKAPWLILGALTLLAVAVVAIVIFGLQGQTSVDAIAEGQCFADFGQFQENEIRSTVSSADCTGEHALEVFEVTSDPYLDFADYPGSTVIKDVAFRHCLLGFEQFVGIAYDESLLDVWALYPTEGSWDLNDDREVVCMVGAFDQSLTTGTLEGSRR